MVECRKQLSLASDQRLCAAVAVAHAELADVVAQPHRQEHLLKGGQRVIARPAEAEVDA